jgi:site-specific recombinase XerD
MEPTLLTSFKSWLATNHYSPSTIRNYLVDTNRYLQTSTGDVFSPESVSSYLATIASDSNKNRYLSSLSKFFQFALDQKLITVDPLKLSQKPKLPQPEDALADYQNYLTKKKFFPATIKNYLNDIQQFIDWLKSNSLAQ